MHHDTPAVAVLKIIATWFLVGVSQMSPLQVVQFIAAAMAAIYTFLQTISLIRGWWSNRSKRP